MTRSAKTLEMEVPSGVWSDSELLGLEKRHSGGMSVQQILEVFAAKGDPLSEATFRKYVQLGLLPRSTRVGRKGKHRGSQGLYPATAVRQVAHVRQLMAQGFTIEEIQREFLFVRGDLEALRRQLERVYAVIDDVRSQRGDGDAIVERALAEARTLSEDLLGKLESVERRLSTRARMARAAV